MVEGSLQKLVVVGLYFGEGYRPQPPPDEQVLVGQVGQDKAVGVAGNG
jgi:hypothetical protein